MSIKCNWNLNEHEFQVSLNQEIYAQRYLVIQSNDKILEVSGLKESTQILEFQLINFIQKNTILQMKWNPNNMNQIIVLFQSSLVQSYDISDLTNIQEKLITNSPDLCIQDFTLSKNRGFFDHSFFAIYLMSQDGSIYVKQNDCIVVTIKQMKYIQRFYSEKYEYDQINQNYFRLTNNQVGDCQMQIIQDKTLEYINIHKVQNLYLNTFLMISICGKIRIFINFRNKQLYLYKSFNIKTNLVKEQTEIHQLDMRVFIQINHDSIYMIDLQKFEFLHQENDIQKQLDNIQNQIELKLIFQKKYKQIIFIQNELMILKHEPLQMIHCQQNKLFHNSYLKFQDCLNSILSFEFQKKQELQILIQSTPQIQYEFDINFEQHDWEGNQQKIQNFMEYHYFTILKNNQNWFQNKKDVIQSYITELQKMTFQKNHLSQAESISVKIQSLKKNQIQIKQLIERIMIKLNNCPLNSGTLQEIKTLSHKIEQLQQQLVHLESQKKNIKDLSQNLNEDFNQIFKLFLEENKLLQQI